MTSTFVHERKRSPNAIEETNWFPFRKALHHHRNINPTISPCTVRDAWYIAWYPSDRIAAARVLENHERVSNNCSSATRGHRHGHTLPLEMTSAWRACSSPLNPEVFPSSTLNTKWVSSAFSIYSSHSWTLLKSRATHPKKKATLFSITSSACTKILQFSVSVSYDNVVACHKTQYPPARNNIRHTRLGGWFLTSVCGGTRYNHTPIVFLEIRVL